MTTEPTLAKVQLTEGLGPLPPQREGQYLTMTICGTKDDPAECGHWSSPAHVQWRIDKAVTEDRERCAKLVEQVADDCDEWRPLDGSRGVALRAAAVRIRGA